ncbi:hypothetical protein NDU88_007604 [Pleurodeles waltl]|uniref:Uncharacterized protein n=1 Tax=Pleurodeles waltl TaxID=8319 RepID=A0AAV7WE21_PLEWA|nr:hypothetical protein NDU88_007604 [Pleurodeles waltl]
MAAIKHWQTQTVSAQQGFSLCFQPCSLPLRFRSQAEVTLWDCETEDGLHTHGGHQALANANSVRAAGLLPLLPALLDATPLPVPGGSDAVGL